MFTALYHYMMYYKPEMQWNQVRKELKKFKYISLESLIK
jgi:hypothetical protein